MAYSDTAAAMSDAWDETTSIGTLRSDDLARAGHRLSLQPLPLPHARHAPRRTAAWARSTSSSGATTRPASIEAVVGKVFHSNYLYQLRTDEVTRRDHHNNLAAMARIAAIEHPNILPTYVSAPIADNYLFVTPRMGMTLLEAIGKHNLTPRARTKLLVQALEGLVDAARRAARPSRLHAAQHPRRRGRERRLPVRLRSRDVARRRRQRRPIATTTRAGSSARPAGRSRPRRSIRR